jgi:hypothetical protein
MTEIDRIALIIRPTQKFIDWLVSITAEESLLNDHIGQDPTVVLIPIFESDEELTDYINENCRKWMEFEFASWCMHEKDWPEGRDGETFQEYFDLEILSLVVDNELEDDFGTFDNTTIQ